VRSLREHLGGARARLRLYVKRAQRAWFAFNASEFDYRLGLLSVGDYNVAYRKGTADERVLAHSFDDDIFLAAIPEWEPKADDIVIDVGAHIGTFAMLVAPRVRRVYAIEASEEACDYLRVNCLLNGLRNVDVSRLALGGTSGMTRLYRSPVGNWGNTIMRKESRLAEPVRICTLTDFMRDHGIRRCDLLRMNCEGAEFPTLLATAPEVLTTIRHMLVLYHPDLAQGATPEQLESHLRRSGFEVEIRRRSHPGGWMVATQRSAGCEPHASRRPT
jgi:FkbM family methyltransferase